MTPLEALRDLQKAANRNGIPSEEFTGALAVAFHVLKENQCPNCGCILKTSERRRIGGKRVCAICGDYYDSWVKK